jgi:hypothetical protein
MKSITPNRRVVFGAGVAVLATVTLAFATAAFGTGASDSAKIAKLERQVAALQTEVKSHAAIRSQLAVLNVGTRVAYIDAAGMHGMEGRYTTTGLTTRDVGTIQNVLAFAAKIAWPEALQNDARELVASCRAFLSAWNAGNKDEAFTQLKAAHASYHALSASGWQWMSWRAK